MLCLEVLVFLVFKHVLVFLAVLVLACSFLASEEMGMVQTLVSL